MKAIYSMSTLQKRHTHIPLKNDWKKTRTRTEMVCDIQLFSLSRLFSPCVFSNSKSHWHKSLVPLIRTNIEYLFPLKLLTRSTTVAHYCLIQTVFIDDKRNRRTMSSCFNTVVFACSHLSTEYNRTSISTTITLLYLMENIKFLQQRRLMNANIIITVIYCDRDIFLHC